MLGTLGASWAYLAIILGALVAATSSKQQKKAARSSKQQQTAENRSKQQQTVENIQIGGPGYFSLSHKFFRCFLALLGLFVMLSLFGLFGLLALVGLLSLFGFLDFLALLGLLGFPPEGFTACKTNSFSNKRASRSMLRQVQTLLAFRRPQFG